MKAIILAAGRGSRMGELTKESPKCLVKLAEKSLLEWQLFALNNAVIDEIGIIKGYQADKIKVAQVTNFFNPNWNETNMVMSLFQAKSWLEANTCIVSYSDIAYSSEIVKKLAVTEGDIVITYDRLWLHLWEKRFDNPLLDAESFRTNQEGILLEIGDRVENLNEIKGQYMGLLKITPKGWLQIKDFVSQLPLEQQLRLDMTSLLKGLLKKGYTINTIPIEGNWCEVDSTDDLNLYNEALCNETTGLACSHLHFIKKSM